MEWYHPDDRPMPWKGEADPYKIWISEVILQQTRVKQGWDYYKAFIKTFPNVETLASADIDQVMKQWQGLGYYSRARNLHQGAQQIIRLFDGHLPASYNQLLSVKGIGAYTAAAIASFAFNLPYPVVDGNVIRVLSRFFGIDKPATSKEGKALFQKTAQDVLDRNNPAIFNQAIMDFGATLCTPTQPLCSECPVRLNCIAFLENKINALPVRLPKAIKRSRYFNYIVYRCNDNLMIFQRPMGDIYAGMYEFYLTESSDNQMLHFGKAPFVHKKDIKIKEVVRLKKHILTHQVLHPIFYIIETHIMPDLTGGIVVSIDELKRWAFPKFIQQFIDEYLMPSTGKATVSE